MRMFSSASDGKEADTTSQQGSPQKKFQRSENHPPNAVDDFPIYEDGNGSSNIFPFDDNPVIAAIIRAPRISNAEISSGNERIENKIGKLAADNDRIEN